MITDSASELRARIADRIRFERRRLGRTQEEFADWCGIPLRTYKRVELGKCDSLEAFLRIVICFERSSGLELLFPPKPIVIEDRSAPAMLERLKKRIQKA